MVEIKLHNTASRSKEVFTPIDPANVRMYVCGPTVYDRAHLGNARPVVVFDVLYRLLRHVYGPDHVTYVRNFTDVDDKIIERADRDGKPIDEITSETTRWYLEDMGALGALEPDQMPRATQHIGDMVRMIEGLVELGFAYSVRAESNNPPEEYVLADREAMLQETALFEVETYDEYGRLSGRSVDDMIAGARVEVAPYKRNPMDFVLWKPAKNDEPGWDSPWGYGRPGWHIECSAMSKSILGDTFDIHGGGLDLLFPHHENERAQSCCANGTDTMANYWLHNEMLQVEGKKMSKSLGNFFTVHDLLEGTQFLGKFTGAEIRTAFLLSHYRSVMDFGAARRKEARVVANEFASLLGSKGSETLKALRELDVRAFDRELVLPEIVTALADDLDTTKAINLLRRKSLYARYAASDRDETFLKRVFASQFILGFDLRSSPLAEDKARDFDELHGVMVRAFEMDDEIDRIKSLIIQARENGDYSRSDSLRNALIAAGTEVRISKEGVTVTRLSSFDPSKLTEVT